MRNITRFGWLLFIIFTLSFSFNSCKDKPEDNKTPVIDDNVIYSPDVNATIILGDGVAKKDVNALSAEYFKNVGKEISIVSAASSPVAHEIVIGKTDRYVSERAYRILAIAEKEQQVGYAIYSDGKSVGIAFNEAIYGENIAFNEALDFFINNYMKQSSLKLDDSVVYYTTFFPIDKQKERDDKATEKLWELKLSQITAKLEGDEEAASGILSSLKSLRAAFNNDYSIVTYIANLYDPVTGGFYYSNSARNNEGYLPDLESTYAALEIVESILTGYGGTITDYFGEDIAAQFVSFTSNMQEKDGYFYHPQWSHDLINQNSKRKERDVLNAVNILELFGESPLYATPNEVGGSVIAKPASSLVLPLADKCVQSVSRLVSIKENKDEIYIPSHLRSSSSFVEYLSSLGISSDTSGACEDIYSEISLYLSIDEILEEKGENYRLISLLKHFLKNSQKSATGLWSSKSEVSSADIGALVYIIKLYNAIGEVIPRYETIFDTIIEFLINKVPENISDISSAWSALAAIVGNVTTYGDEHSGYTISYRLVSLYQEIEHVIRKTLEALGVFLNDDGSFSTTPQNNPNEYLGVPVSVPATDEGDINATLIAIKSIYLAVFRTLNIGTVPIFNTSDRMMFQKTLLDMGVIVKNEISATEPLTFEFYDIGSSNGVRPVMDSANSKAEVVVDDSEHGKVLRLYAAPDNNTNKFYFDLMTEDIKGAICFTAELDICVLPETSKGGNGSRDFARLYLYNDVYMIALERLGDTVRFIERSSRGLDSDSYNNDLGVRANIGEWFNLRIEYYPGTADTVRIKIYFNEECIAVTDNYYASNKYNGNKVPASNFTSFAIFDDGSRTMDMLVDNVIVQKSYKSYVLETSQSLNINVDIPDKSQKINSFEGYDTGYKPPEFKANGESSSIFVTTDSDGNKLLSVSEKAGEIILPLEQRGAGINSAVIEFDLTVDKDTAAGAQYRISFNEYLFKERIFGAMQLTVSENKGIKYITLSEVLNGSATAPYDTVMLSIGVKYRLRFQLFFDENVLVTCVDGQVVGISTSVLSQCKKFNLGETTIESMTPEVKSTILLDNVVSEKANGDFAQLTAPTESRKEYTFDTADGVELSGVSPSGGVLSFEGVSGYGNAYALISVNKRTNASNMALIGLDVLKRGASGRMIIYLEDTSGNKIAALALVAKESGVDIHEYTANEIYKTSIHTVTKDYFNLSIEYSAVNESFNILIDGEYVAASSLTYTMNSAEHDFENLRISAYGAVGFAVDNLFAEKICGIFKAQKVTLPNLDGNESVITYETSSFASLPKFKSINFGVPTSYLRIREANISYTSDGIAKNAVSKVLEFYCGSGSVANSIVISKNQTEYDKNAVLFETDIMLQSTSNKISSVGFNFVSGAAGSKTQYRFNIDVGTTGTKLKAKAMDGKDFTVDLDVNEGEWFKLRLEYRDTPHDFTYDGKNDCLLRAYINGVLIGEGHICVYPDEIQTASSITMVNIGLSSGRECKIFLDDTVFGMCNMNYIPPVPADTDTITYTPGVITNKTQFTFGKNTSTAIISDMTDITGQVGKVLDFYTSNGSNDILDITPTVTLDGANATVFETDIMIKPQSETATLYLEPLNKKLKQPFRVIIKAKKDGNVTISSADIPETVIGASGGWIHIKIEYMNPMVDYTGDRMYDILYKVYINNSDTPLVGYKPYTSASYYNPSDITKYTFTATAESIANIYLDNTRFWQLNLTPDKAPEFEYSEEGSIDGDSGFDNGGWS